jgi:hypothetical protein
MKCTDSIMNSKLLVCWCLLFYHSDQTRSFHFIVVCFFFGGFSYENVRITYHFFSSKKYLILTFKIKFIINLQIYTTSLLCTPLTILTRILHDEKGCITASKLIKESEKYCKSYLVSMNRLFCDSHERE